MDTSFNVSDELASFIRSARSYGISDSFTVSLLRKNGWSEQRVFRASTFDRESASRDPETHGRSAQCLIWKQIAMLPSRIVAAAGITVSGRRASDLQFG